MIGRWIVGLVFVGVVVLSAAYVLRYNDKVQDDSGLGDERNVSSHVTKNDESSNSTQVRKGVPFRLLAASTIDGTAVVKEPDSAMRVVRVGDQLMDARYRVEKISDNTLVVTDLSSKDLLIVSKSGDGKAGQSTRVTNSLDIEPRLPIVAK